MARIAAFTVLAFAISWAIWSPLVAGAAIDQRAAWVLYYTGVAGPAAAAFWCTRNGDRESFRRRLRSWRAAPRWCAFAIAVPFAIHGLAVAAAVAQSRGTVGFRAPSDVAATAMLMVILVPFEESGWRGYLLPALHRRYSAVAASLIVACIWAAWHLPLAFAAVGYQRSEGPWSYMLRFMVTIVPVTLLMTWLFNRTSESVPIASLFHVAVNMADYVIAVPEDVGGTALWIGAALGMALAAAIWRVRQPSLSHA